ncbi:hypothetical protein NKG99_27915 [Mesorhizobium sp. M1409]|uniref:hypothetical protein n=1 Tax=unclassified Mesorhizobium TaxID=325217 RepID=UPI0033391494
MRITQTAIDAKTINPDFLTYAEKVQYEGYLRHEETNAAILKLAGEGIPIKEIVRRTDHRVRSRHGWVMDIGLAQCKMGYPP